MGGFTDGGVPSPAPDYPPENNFDPTAFANQIGAELKRIGTPGFNGESLANAIAEGLMKVLAFSFKWSPVGVGLGQPLMDNPQAFYTKLTKVLAEVVIAIVTDGGQPAMDVLKTATTFFTGQIVSELAPMQHGSAGSGPSGMSEGAQGLFDGVMAPLMGLTAAVPPTTAGAGITNAQFTLGGIIGIHLHTFLINILSNLTGLGFLKFFNSFDECITGSLNSRSMGRGALKPYLDKFIATPLTRDLNVAMPLAVGSAAMLIKRYLRGVMTEDDCKAALRGLGYDTDTATDIMLDAAKLLDPSAVVYLVKHGTWQESDALEALQHAGYSQDLARAEYQKEWNTVVDSQTASLADDLLTYAKDFRMTIEAMVTALQSAGFTSDEVRAYQLRAAYAQEISKRLSYTQVKSLYTESLVDLDYVLSFLTNEGYTDNDANLLVLLDFTKKEERDQAQLLLSNIRRGQLDQALKDQAAADAARRAALSELPSP